MAAGNGDEILYNEVYLPPYFLSPISRTKVTFPLALVTNFQLNQYFILFSPSNNSSSPITASFQSISLPSLLQRSTPVSKLEVTFCTQFNGGKGREGGIGDGITTQQLSLCLSPQILTRSKVPPSLSRKEGDSSRLHDCPYATYICRKQGLHSNIFAEQIHINLLQCKDFFSCAHIQEEGRGNGGKGICFCRLSTTPPLPPLSPSAIPEVY